jgi:hypothetical protein
LPKIFLIFSFAAWLILPALSFCDFSWDKNDKTKFELVDEVPEYNSIINWTAGKVHTEVYVPAGEVSPNVGKYINNNYTQVKDELRQNLIKAMGYVRISDIFLLKDYYTMKSDVRYEIISYVDRAFYYPVVQKPGKFVGVVELPLFGKGGLANIFYRDIERVELTNYIQYNSRDQEYFEGLIIDTMGFNEFRPSLNMRIYDEDGVLLYGPETIDKTALEKSGVCEYTTSLVHAFNSPRCGSHVFYTLPFSLKGRMSTSFVLNNKDAARLFANPRTVSFLNQSRVIVVKSPQKGD